jgi:DUF1680 family protein
MNTTNYTAPISLKDITIRDAFWGPVMERVRSGIIPYQWEALNDRIEGAEKSFCIRNFKLAAELTHPELDYGVPKDIGHGGFVFQDSDVAKWLEAVAYALMWIPIPRWRRSPMRRLTPSAKRNSPMVISIPITSSTGLINALPTSRTTTSCIA